MHFVSPPPPGWPAILDVSPQRCFIKAIDDTGVLRDAKLKWVSLGRDPDTLVTDLRHYEFIYPFEREYSWEELKAIWRINFWRIIDAHYLQEFAPYVDMLEELNEYYDTRMALDEDLLLPYLSSAQAAVMVWNGEFRGKTVHPPGGGEGHIPDRCRLIIGNSPVGNDIPRDFFKLAIDSGSVLGYHPYAKWEGRSRDPQDFRYHSGRWHYLEQAYGLKPVWAFTECGPYLDSGRGWRSGDCMGADLPLLVEGMRAWVQDVQATDAYREGRILGPGAMFTSGGFGWEMYQYTSPELVEVYRMFAMEWQPGDGSMDETTRAEIAALAQAILDKVRPGAWYTLWPIGVLTPPRTLAAPGKALTFYKRDFTPMSPQPLLDASGQPRVITWTMSATEHVVVTGVHLLRVVDLAGTEGDWYVAAMDVSPGTG